MPQAQLAVEHAWAVQGGLDYARPLSLNQRMGTRLAERYALILDHAERDGRESCTGLMRIKHVKNAPPHALVAGLGWAIQTNATRIMSGVPPIFPRRSHACAWPPRWP